MNLHQPDVQSFAMAAYQTFNLEKFSINADIAIEALQKEIVAEFNLLNSEETKNMRFKRFKFKGSVPNDYSESIIELSDGKKIICGIRYMNCNLDLSFIHCTANFEVSSKKEVLSLYEEFKDKFRVFSPKYLCFYTQKKIDADFIGSTYLVTTAQELRDRKGWDNEGRFTLELVLNEDYYDWYQKGYEEFHLEAPALRDRVTVNNPSVMQESLDQKLLYIAKIGDEKMGLIAAVRTEFLGHPGIYFNEIFISKKWKGQGLAKAVQRKFLTEVANGKEIIWGTIDYANIPSFQTALANGRKPIRYENFFGI